MAIIGILAAIILPSLRTARAKAKQVACLDNLHQIGRSFLEYANDFQMHLPDWGCEAHTQNPVQQGEACWHTHLYVNGYADSADVFYCPANGEAVAEGIKQADGQFVTYGVREGRLAKLEQPRVVTYCAWPGMSSWALEHGTHPAYQDHSPIGRKEDSHLMLLYEQRLCFGWDVARGQTAWQWWDPPGDVQLFADAIHPGQTFDRDGTLKPGSWNILWLDGHVTNSTTRRVIDEWDIVRTFDELF